MSAIIKSFKLMGYSIRQLSNNTFIAKRTDDTMSLFDSEGKMIVGNANHIQKLSDTFYKVIDKNEKSDIAILYDNKGNIVDRAPYTSIKELVNLIHVGRKDSKGNTVYNIYEENNKARYENILGEGIGYFESTEGSKLVYTNADDVYVIENGLAPRKLPVRESHITSLNSHYIQYTKSDSTSQFVMDYNLNHIHEGKKVSIDLSKLDSSNILDTGKGYINILDKEGKMVVSLQDILSKEDFSSIFRVRFTSEPNVILINTFDSRDYLFNVVTRERSKSYYFIDTNTFIGEINRPYRGLDIIDRKTLASTKVISNCSRVSKLVDSYVVEREGSTVEEYYNLDLKPLIHEF